MRIALPASYLCQARTLMGSCDGGAKSGNVGNLPLVLIAALCSSTSAPAVVADAVPPGQCAELGIAYIVFAMWVAGLFQFSVANYLLRRPAEVGAGFSYQVVAACWVFSLFTAGSYPWGHPQYLCTALSSFACSP